MSNDKEQGRVFVTGTAGFIGFHLAKALLEDEFLVHGYDGVTDYYDVSLKEKRLAMLEGYKGFSFSRAMLEDRENLESALTDFNPDVVLHLAAQAGVRYSLENPQAYIQSNVVGTMNLLESIRHVKPRHLLMASTSSVYGANTDMPFLELGNTDHQLTLYAATKKANESMSHAYAHLWEIPTTMFRFFTVYGPWGRPDMALFKFADAILRGDEIDVYNFGKMYRDFTYIDDLVKSVCMLIQVVPSRVESRIDKIKGDSLSPVAPWRVVNIGNSQKVRLSDYIEAIEKELGMSAKKNFMPLQPGDVPATFADTSLLKALTGYAPSTNVGEGVAKFVAWYTRYLRE